MITGIMYIEVLVSMTSIFVSRWYRLLHLMDEEIVVGPEFLEFLRPFLEERHLTFSIDDFHELVHGLKVDFELSEAILMALMSVLRKSGFLATCTDTFQEVKKKEKKERAFEKRLQQLMMEDPKSVSKWRFYTVKYGQGKYDVCVVKMNRKMLKFLQACVKKSHYCDTHGFERIVSIQKSSATTEINRPRFNHLLRLYLGGT